MPWLLTPGIAAASLFAVVSSLLFLRARRNYRSVPLLPAVPPGKTPADCMVVIPARNEEGVVGGAVRSFPPDTVIVVDDQSSDKTADEAREAGAGVLEAPPLAAASGKANACMAGARILTTRWILFADADTRYRDGFLESVVEAAYHAEVFFLSIHLTPRPESLLEHLLEPYAAALFFSGANLQRDPALLFQGQCVLVLREAYEFVGGHAAVWNHLTEDLHLVRLADRHRMGYAVVRASSLGYARNYTSWKAALRRTDRQAFRFVHTNSGASATVLLTALVAALWLPLAAWLWLSGHRVAPLLVLLLVVLELRPWYGNGPRALLAPWAVYAALPLLVHGLSAVFVKRHLVWKGRRVKAT